MLPSHFAEHGPGFGTGKRAYHLRQGEQSRRRRRPNHGESARALHCDLLPSREHDFDTNGIHNPLKMRGECDDSMMTIRRKMPCRILLWNDFAQCVLLRRPRVAEKFIHRLETGTSRRSPLLTS